MSENRFPEKMAKDADDCLAGASFFSVPVDSMTMAELRTLAGWALMEMTRLRAELRTHEAKSVEEMYRLAETSNVRQQAMQVRFK